MVIKPQDPDPDPQHGFKFKLLNIFSLRLDETLEVKVELPLFSPPADSSVPDEEDRASFCGQEEDKDTVESLLCETDPAIDTYALILR